MDAIIITNAEPKELAAFVLALQKRREHRVDMKLGGKSIAQVVSETIRDMSGEREGGVNQ